MEWEGRGVIVGNWKWCVTCMFVRILGLGRVDREVNVSDVL